MQNSTMQISTHKGNLEILTSGIVHIDNESELIEIKIDVMTFVFKFMSDEGNSRYIGSVEGETLQLELYNHKNPLGEGLLTPYLVGDFNNRPLFLTYYVNTVNVEKSIRRFEYVFYMGGV